MTNEKAWEILLNESGFISDLDNNDPIFISSDQMRAYREPRLMAKIDHSKNLPKIFRENKLSILPISRGGYFISKFENYKKFTLEPHSHIYNFPIDNLETLAIGNIISESIALNAAMASGIMNHFLDDETLVSTISGRMGSGSFDFYIKENTGRNREIAVNNAQIEIDAAFEGRDFLAIVEAKMDIPEEGDFLIRQLRKTVRPVFLTYSNGIYVLREYNFQETRDYNSINLIRQSLYSIEDTSITHDEIEDLLNSTSISPELEGIPFPQADFFPRVINLCELLKGRELNKDMLGEKYDFDKRQADYYANAARYLGLVDKPRDSFYHLSKKGLDILGLPYKRRQLAYCECIFSHAVFNSLMRQVFATGRLPQNNEIIEAIKRSDSSLGEVTLKRRSSTVKGWLSWVIKLARFEPN